MFYPLYQVTQSGSEEKYQKSESRSKKGGRFLATEQIVHADFLHHPIVYNCFENMLFNFAGSVVSILILTANTACKPKSVNWKREALETINLGIIHK